MCFFTTKFEMTKCWQVRLGMFVKAYSLYIWDDCLCKDYGGWASDLASIMIPLQEGEDPISCEDLSNYLPPEQLCGEHKVVFAAMCCAKPEMAGNVLFSHGLTFLKNAQKVYLLIYNWRLSRIPYKLSCSKMIVNHL